MLLSFAAWIELSFLSGYPKSASFVGLQLEHEWMVTQTYESKQKGAPSK